MCIRKNLAKVDTEVTPTYATLVVLVIFLKGKIRVRVEKLKKNKYFPSFRGGGGPKKRWKIPSSSFFFLNPTLIELSDSFGKPY